MNKIYMVVRSSGDYCDYTECIVRAYEDKKLADLYVEKANSWRPKERYSYEHSPYDPEEVWCADFRYFVREQVISTQLPEDE